jgi:deazaflavin-dependent oxidoreductase (nitroreductase family)
VTDEIGEQLARWGKVAALETRGRRSGRPARTAVGFIEQSDGSLLVAAGSPDADWALNLRHDPHCRATIADATRDYLAAELGEADHALAVTQLILKYGTTAERLGAGRAFRLAPVGDRP